MVHLLKSVTWKSHSQTSNLASFLFVDFWGCTFRALWKYSEINVCLSVTWEPSIPENAQCICHTPRGTENPKITLLCLVCASQKVLQGFGTHTLLLSSLPSDWNVDEQDGCKEPGFTWSLHVLFLKKGLTNADVLLQSVSFIDVVKSLQQMQDIWCLGEQTHAYLINKSLRCSLQSDMCSVRPLAGQHAGWWALKSLSCLSRSPEDSSSLEEKQRLCEFFVNVRKSWK